MLYLVLSTLIFFFSIDCETVGPPKEAPDINPTTAQSRLMLSFRELCINNQALDTWYLGDLKYDNGGILFYLDSPSISVHRSEKSKLISEVITSFGRSIAPNQSLCVTVPQVFKEASTFNIEVNFNSTLNIIEGRLTEVATEAANCQLFDHLIHSVEVPPILIYRCKDTLTIATKDHTFCIDNMTPAAWNATGVLEAGLHKWYDDRTPNTALVGKEIPGGTKVCFNVNKRHSFDQSFNIYLEQDDGWLSVRVHHAAAQNNRKWNTRQLVDLRTFEEPPVGLTLQDNTLTLTSLSHTRIMFCIDNQSIKTWTVLHIADVDERRWGLYRNPSEILADQEMAADSRVCFPLYLKSFIPTSFRIAMQEAGVYGQAFDTIFTPLLTEVEGKCWVPVHLDYSSPERTIQVVTCNNTLTILPILEGVNGTMCTHQKSSCRLKWETVDTIDNTLNDEEVERSYTKSTGITKGRLRSNSSEYWTRTKTAHQKEQSSQGRTNSRFRSEHERLEAKTKTGKHSFSSSHTSSVNAFFVSSSLTTAYQGEWGTAKTSGSSHRHGHDHSSERTTGSRNSMTEERGRDQMIGFIESLNEEMTESKTVTDVIKVGPHRMKKLKQLVLTCDCFGFRTPKFRAEAVKDENGSYVWTPPASQRHRRYLHKHLHCQEGAIRPVSRLCNQYEECHHNKWRIRSSKPAGAASDDAEGC